MKTMKKALAFLLTAAMLLPFASCSPAAPEKDEATETNGTETTETAEETPVIEKNLSYLTTYGDTDAADAWLKENIEDTDTPPVTFSVDGTDAAALIWTKAVGEPVTVTDYPDSGDPAERTIREIVYTCADKQLELKLTLTTYPNYPVVEMASTLTNLSAENSGKIKDLYAYGEMAAADEYTVHYNRGSQKPNVEYEPLTETLAENHKRVKFSSENGLPCSDYLPYFNVENQKDGGGVVGAVNWQGSWTVNCEIKNGRLCVMAGQKGLSAVMLGGEHLKVSGLVLLFYKDGDWQFGQNIWRRWIIEHNLMRNTGRRDYRQNVYLCSGIQNADDDMAAVDIFSSSGVTDRFNCTFEIDAGWYECGETWESWYATGNWEADTERYPAEKLAALSEKCKAAGAGFALWMEPERFMKDSPEWTALGEENRIDVGRDNVLLNYGKQAAEDYAVDLVDGTVKQYGLTVYRQDFNTQNREYWEAADAAERETTGVTRRGVAENHACEGYVNAWTRIAAENPGLIFDSCSGGGRRNDLETIRFSFAHTKSDYWSDVTVQQCQNLGVLSWLIFTGTGFADATSLYDVRSRLTLSIGVGATVNETTLSALDEWASLQKYMYNDYYALSDYSQEPDANIAMQFHDHENGEGMLIAYLRQGGAYGIVPKALDPGQNYKVWEKDHPDQITVVSGAELMEQGVTVAGESGVPSAIPVFYEKTSDPVFAE